MIPFPRRKLKMNERIVSLIRPQEVHLWFARGDDSSCTLGLLEGTLSASERAKADMFRYERHRARYVFSHGVLRSVLAHYLACKPNQLEFEQNEFGKPFLPNPDVQWLKFNMSHAEGLVIVAVTRNRLIGADVEFERTIEDMEGIARHCFSNLEHSLFEAACAGKKRHVFFTCWSRKEAYIKAIGTGLSIPLTSFDAVIPSGMGGCELPGTMHNAETVERWWLSDIQVLEGYAGAVVVQGNEPWISYKKWDVALELVS